MSKFTRGHIPWNKGKKGSQVVWNKGKPNPLSQGKNNPNWKGGKISSRGYTLIHSPEHPFKTRNNNSVLEHRLIVEAHLGRYLHPEEVVHHRNEIKSDNSPLNLICFTSESAHQKFHKAPNNIRPEEIVFDGRTLA